MLHPTIRLSAQIAQRTLWVLPVIALSIAARAGTLPPYGEPGFLATGDGPVSIVVRDLNGDGIPDVVTADRFSDSVTVFLGRGSARFERLASPGVGMEPVSIVAADLNGDDVLDLATANFGSDSLSVLLGHGDGTFHREVRHPAGEEPAAILAADFNGDGALDLASANRLSNDVSVLIGREGGRFGQASTFPTGERPTAMAAADMDGDGVVDLVVANYDSDTVSIHPGNGDGTFRAGPSVDVVGGPASVAIADLDGDANPDVAAISTTFLRGSMSLLRGRGDGTLLPASTLAEGRPSGAVVVADVNDDGVPDLIRTTSNFLESFVSVYLGFGNGQFNNAVEFTTGDLPLSIAVADLDGDELLDFVTANYNSDDIAVLLGSGVNSVIEVDLGPGTLAEIREILLRDFSVGDRNEDRMLSLAEATAILPSLTEDHFAALDVDGSGSLTENEVAGTTGELPGSGCMPATTTKTVAAVLADLFLIGLAAIFGTRLLPDFQIPNAG